MMFGLLVRGEAIARAARQRRLQAVAAAVRERGLTVEVTAESVICRGRKLLKRWLEDPVLRFAGRAK
jgi:hypothetical protein